MLKHRGESHFPMLSVLLSRHLWPWTKLKNALYKSSSLEHLPRSPPQLVVKDTHRYLPYPSCSPSATVVASNSHDGIIVGLQSNSNHEEPEKGLVAPVDRHLMRTPDPTPSEKFLPTHKARECNWAKILDWRRYKNPRVFCAWPCPLVISPRFPGALLTGTSASGVKLQGRSR